VKSGTEGVALGGRAVRMRSILVPFPAPTKTGLLSIRTRVLFLNDAFLRNMMRPSGVMQTLSVMHAFGALKERIASQQAKRATSHLKTNASLIT